jgi:hypothetical protein
MIAISQLFRKHYKGDGKSYSIYGVISLPLMP